MSFKNKVVIVTGASSGIGAVTAVELTKQGADVVMVARNQLKLDKVTAQCEKVGKKPLVINADLVKDTDVKKVIEQTIKKFGKLDVLINNAGFANVSPFGNEDNIKVFDAIHSLNLRSIVYLTHLATPYLMKTNGNIVNVSSVAALRAGIEPGFWAYCTSKAGLDHFSRCAAHELAPKGVRVNTVNPGPVQTDFVENMGIQEADNFFEKAAGFTALNRVSESEEVVDVILFLASDRARGVTGASWVVDNGFLIK